MRRALRVAAVSACAFGVLLCVMLVLPMLVIALLLWAAWSVVTLTWGSELRRVRRRFMWNDRGTLDEVPRV